MRSSGFVVSFGLVLLAPLALSACAQAPQAEVYSFPGGDILLSSTSHPHGYGQSQCFLCHLPARIHTVDRLGDPTFSLAQSLVAQSGLAACSGCHGANGVAP